MVINWPLLWIAIAGGALSCLSPCILPLVPAYAAVLGGGGSRSQLAVTAAAFVGGFSLVFVILGTSAGALGGLLLSHLGLLRRIAGIMVVVFGLYLLGLVRLPQLDRDSRRLGPPRQGPAGAFALGIAFAAGWTPCVGPVLATILLLAASEGSAVGGALLLFTYAIGMSVPLLVLGLVFRQAVGKLGRHSRAFGTVAGWLLVMTGVAMTAGWLDRLTALISR